MNDALVITVQDDQVGLAVVERGGWRSLPDLNPEIRALCGRLWIELVGGVEPQRERLRPDLQPLDRLRDSVVAAQQALQEPLNQLAAILVELQQHRQRLEHIERILADAPTQQWMLTTLAPAVERRRMGGQ